MSDVTLSKDDRRAVDLLLDRSARAAGNSGHGNGKGHTVYASTDATLGQRIARTQRLLQLLELLPSGEPPADLLPRTLRYVQQFSDRPVATIRPPQVPYLIDSQRPHA